MFSSEYCKIFKIIYFEEHLLTAASDVLKQLFYLFLFIYLFFL